MSMKVFGRSATLVSAVLLLSVTLSSPNYAQSENESVLTNGLFELGDGIAPPVPGIGDILGTTQPGPDWEDLFNADRMIKDDYPPPQGNGVPDFVDLYGGQWAVFTSDDILQDSTFVVTGSETLVYSGRRMAAEHDLGNAYVYSALDPQGNLVLFAGVERLSSGDSVLEVEINQAHIRLGHGPPWKVKGGKTVDDLLIRLSFAAGALTAVDVSKWAEVDPAEGIFDWLAVETVPGETCNAAETICTVCNANNIDGGPWPNFDSAGDPEQLTAGRFAELGVNVGALLGSQPGYTTVQLRTPQDIAFSYFAEGN